jgi:triacylglycerol lipase
MEKAAYLQKKENELEQARDKYYALMAELNPFTHEEFLHSAPSLMRAAYSDRMAWIMAVMAKMAYIKFETSADERHKLEVQLDRGGFTLVQTFSEAGTQAFLARNRFYAVLAFRGTEPTEWADVRADIRAYKKSVSEGRVHAGFLDAYKLVADEIVKNLEDTNHDKWPLYITGHSLGGALATVATQELDIIKGIGDQIAACYTFGSPRVGNKKYERALKVPVYRIVHSTDIVTLVPNIGYTHVGDPRFISRSGDYYRKIPFFLRAWEMLLAVLPFWWGRWVGSHDMSTYRNKLEKIALERNRPAHGASKRR